MARRNRKKSAARSDKARSAKLQKKWHPATLDSPRPLGLGETKLVAIIVCVAFVTRLAFFFLNKRNNPLFFYPIMDSLYHHDWAKDILSGDFWGREVFFRAPLYPYLLALLYKLSGSSIAFAILCQHAIGALSAGLVYVLSREFFARRVALLAGLFAALYWPFVYFEGELLIVTLIIFLDLAMLIALCIAVRTGKKRCFLASGLLLGLSAAARPTVLIFLAAMPFALASALRAQARRRSAGAPSGSSKRWIEQTAYVLLGVSIIVAPVIVRNYIVGGDVVPIASQGGVNFYIGNNPESDGRTAIVPGTRPDWWGGYYDAIQLAEKSSGRKLKPSEVSNYYFKKGLAFIFSSPIRASKLTMRKFRLFWSGGERSNNKNIYFFWHRSGMAKIPLPGFWLIAPLGVLGGFILWGRRRTFAILYAFLLSYSAGVIAFFVNARFRLPVLPILIVFGSYAVFFIIEAYAAKRLEFSKASLALIAIALAVNLDFIYFNENKIYADSISHYTLGNAYLKMGKKEFALREYETAIEKHEKYPSRAYSLIARNVSYNLGTLYWENGLCFKAIPLLEGIGGKDKYALLAKKQLADCYAMKGRFEEAIQTYHQILLKKPNDRSALLGLVKAYRLSGDMRSCETILNNMLRADSLDGEAHFELAGILEMRGDKLGAIEHYHKAAKSAEVEEKAYRSLAKLYRKMGKENEAELYFIKSKRRLQRR